MNLRRTLLILSTMAVLSAAIGGYLYYSSLINAAYLEANRQADMRVVMIEKTLSSFLSENLKPVRTLASTPEISFFLTTPNLKIQEKTNQTLDHFKESLGVDVCYIMDKKGLTVASSNRFSDDSFVGKNFHFRPYFQQSMQGAAATYLALGYTSKKRGVYRSYPVFDLNNEEIIGVAVIKDSIDLIEQKLGVHEDEIVAVIDPQGVIFISNKQEWLLKIFSEINLTNKSLISESRQFGSGPWEWTKLREISPQTYTATEGTTYIGHKTDLEAYQGWTVLLLRNQDLLRKALAGPFVRVSGLVILLFCLIIGVTVLFLYKRASSEIMHRKTAEKALTESEERYRSLYNKTPAMLHSIDKEGRLLSVSDYWLKALGYNLDEVIDKKLTKFYTENSRKHAEEIVIPNFFKKGSCSNIPYQFIKKNGELINVLLSAISEKNSQGEIVRSLAISVDVTERTKTEEALRQAKEELSQYSRELEDQVQERTKEISKAQAQLRRLSASIMENQEKERAAIARELHDELGQVLTALRLETVALRDQVGSIAPPLSERSDRMCKLIDNTIDEVRGMAFRLRPGVLDDLGLVDALEVYTGDFERRTGISCFFESNTIPAISDAIATTAYRITQEALTNVARHANASNVEIAIKKEGTKLILSIIDEGEGFDANLYEPEGLGLAGMRERASLAGGTLKIISSPGTGTSIKFEVDL